MGKLRKSRFGVAPYATSNYPNKRRKSATSINLYIPIIVVGYDKNLFNC